MKQYKLVAWPDLPVHYHRTAYRRMLSDMSHRDMTMPQLVAASGLLRHEVREFLDWLLARESLRESECAQADFFGPLGGWLRRALSTEVGSRR